MYMFIAGYPGKNNNCGYSRNRDINDDMVVGSFNAKCEAAVFQKKKKKKHKRVNSFFSHDGNDYFYCLNIKQWIISKT